MNHDNRLSLQNFSSVTVALGSLKSLEKSSRFPGTAIIFQFKIRAVELDSFGSLSLVVQRNTKPPKTNFGAMAHRSDSRKRMASGNILYTIYRVHRVILHRTGCSLAGPLASLDAHVADAGNDNILVDIALLARLKTSFGLLS